MYDSGSFQVGGLIANKYAIERVLGEGGMGVVVAAHHIQLQQRVAIKFLLPAMMAHPVAVSRFVREARACVRIQSEHVARVLDVGELENGSPFMVMEYLEGTDFAQALAASPRQSTESIVEYVLQACEALAEAHSLGIVHRDLKPANLFVTRRPDGSPFIKVLDFGISKSTGGDNGALTNTTAFLGSPLYSSPEQLLSSRSVDARTDIWALGVILYEACAGTTPFNGDSVMEVASRVMQVAPTPLDNLRPDLPRGFAAIVMCCLEKDPTRRFPDVGELARALGPYAPRAARSVDRISGILPPSFRPPPYLDLASQPPPATNAAAISVSANGPAAMGSAATVSSAGLAPTGVTASTQNDWDQKVTRASAERPASSGGTLIVTALAASALIGAGFMVLHASTPTPTTDGTSFAAPTVAPSAVSLGASVTPGPSAGAAGTAGAVAPQASAASAAPPSIPSAAVSAASAASRNNPASPRPRSGAQSSTTGPRNPLDIQLR